MTFSWLYGGTMGTSAFLNILSSPSDNLLFLFCDNEQKDQRVKYCKLHKNANERGSTKSFHR